MQVAHLYNRNQGVEWIVSKATRVFNRDGHHGGLRSGKTVVYYQP